MRQMSLLVSVLAMVAIAAGVFRASYVYFQREELSNAEGRLSLYQSSVTAELERFSHLTHMLAQDTSVIEAAESNGTGTLNLKLQDFAAKAGLDAIYLMNTDGFTIAASNHHRQDSFVGQNYAFRPYFREALAGEQGRFYAIGATTGLPGYFIADAVHDMQEQVIGVIAIKIGFAQLEQSWQASGEQVFLANEDGVVLLSSEPSWRYQVLKPLSQSQRQQIEDARQFPGQQLDPLSWQPQDGQRAKIADDDRIHLIAETAPHGWSLHYFASDDRAVVRAWLLTALVVFTAGMALIFVQIQRARRVGAALQRSEQEEMKLRQANELLAVEIEDRKTAERRLKRTQDELERASRLAALGRLAASVTHELGQPIAAMRNHLVASEIGAGGANALTGKMGGLVDRMEGITRQLKFFATSESEVFGPVDLAAAMQAAIALVEPNLTAAEAKLLVESAPHPAVIRGSRLRIEQVMTNLLRNAVDACEDEAGPEIKVRIGTSDNEAWFEIEDNGHGLGKSTLAELQEPFVTTRESGRGMGLGLAISTSIVNDHDGAMKAQNTQAGGAVFRVSFPVWTADGEEE